LTIYGVLDPGISRFEVADHPLLACLVNQVPFVCIGLDRSGPFCKAIVSIGGQSPPGPQVDCGKDRMTINWVNACLGEAKLIHPRLELIPGRVGGEVEELATMAKDIPATPDLRQMALRPIPELFSNVVDPIRLMLVPDLDIDHKNHHQNCETNQEDDQISEPSIHGTYLIPISPGLHW
jgi:hypothetical protein